MYLIAALLLPASAFAGAGPIGYWKLNEGTGITTADASISGNTGTLTNAPTWTASGKIDNALIFNGGTGFVGINGAGNLANLYQTGMTVMAWIKPTTLGAGGYGRIVEKGIWGLKLQNTNKVWFGGGNFSTTAVTKESSTGVTFGVWQHVVATWDGSGASANVHIYINGVLADGATTEGAGALISDSSYTLAIGNHAPTGDRGFDGTIDDVRIYNRVLTLAEIQSITADLQVPTAPTSFTVTAVTSTQVNLSWTASTDNVGVTGYLVERCQGTSCSTFAQIASPAATSYSDMGLTASTPYSYRVRATDAANNLGSYSGTGSATTPAGSSGTGPIGYWLLNEGSGTTTADATASGNTGTLTNSPAWTASGKIGNAVSFNGGTGYVGITGAGNLADLYQSGMTVMAWIKPTTLGAGGAGRIVEKGIWGLKLQNTNKLWFGGGNFATASVTRESSAGVTFGAWQHVAATWTGSPASANVHLYINGVLADGAVSEGAGATISDASYTLALGNHAPTGDRGFNGTIDDVRIYNRVLTAAEVASIANDTQAPTAPSGLTATAASSTQINLVWTGSTDNVGVTNYLIERCQGASCSSFVQIATVTGTSYSNTGLTASTSYSYRVRATDAAGNPGGYSNTGSATTLASGGDTQAPSTPAGLGATATSSSQITLSWTASTDNVGVTGYLVERCQGAGCSSWAQIATPTVTSYSDAGLTASSSYSYRVRAKDAANNLSDYSSTSSATTTSGGGGDVEPPTTPTALSGTAASSTQINLSWTASSDNVGVTGYLLERCQGASCSSFAQIATPSGTTYSDTALSGSTTYVYRVRAQDAASNPSNYSSSATATTQSGADTQAPSTPTSLTVTPGTTQMTLSWPPSIDNVGVTGYQIERCQGSGCSTFTLIATVSTNGYVNTGLLAGVPYGYRVRATDAAGNFSDYSGGGSGVMGECD
jgi:fibronectin type 3 domain-containing protein